MLTTEHASRPRTRDSSSPGLLMQHPQEGKILACKILCPDTLSLLAKETFIFVTSLGVSDTEAAVRKDKKKKKSVVQCRSPGTSVSEQAKIHLNKK